ncbi:Sec-independent protein translocase subunit TatA [Streptomyces sp. Pv4-95]|uniref:Sec-independent protein translocase subunit TatA n=1 Tax=Streptomyces sp. Pv4-95 TaxID=3049543 RepID=UPI00389189B0
MLRNAFEPWHLVLIILAFVLLFGSKKLPDMARGLGRSMRILKSEAKALQDDGPADAPGQETAAKPATEPHPEPSARH